MKNSLVLYCKIALASKLLRFLSMGSSWLRILSFGHEPKLLYSLICISPRLFVRHKVLLYHTVINIQENRININKNIIHKFYNKN